MSRTNLASTASRLGVLTAVALAAAVATAGPASAHTEVEAADARALAQDVALTFTAESESADAGITKLEVILPEGIAPGDITYKEGPKGWKLAPTGRGYTVSGPKLAVGEDAEYVVSVRQLPDAKSLVFKTLQSYSDGEVDRWIELDDSGGDDEGHGHPAPRLALKAAAPGAKAVSPTPTQDPTPTEKPTASTDATTPSPTPTASAKAAADSSDDDGVPLGVPLGIGLGVLALGGVAWWLRSRRTTGTS
ncbi:DUF1775 domain-containing protein [Streptomyces griseus]|uniref:DUF1775 domain-containing protein n=1 Tax=Streptomyces griseus TaxID=1911 RepID=UPI000562D758|nr:DUF1775 domain-containing protein [Streptomyces griseus]